MKPKICTYGDARDDILVSYLYEEITADERARFEHHLTGCALCRSELDALTSLRGHLGRWSAPEPVLRSSSHGYSEPSTVGPPTVGWHLKLGTLAEQMPAWAQVGAAALFIGLAVGLANLHVSYTGEGLFVRTGWMRTNGAPGAPAGPPSARSFSGQGAVQPWQADLAAFEQQLRAELRDQHALIEQAALSSKPTDDEVMRRVRTLVQDSERRQQRELALRVGEVAREMQGQRQVDLVKIDRSLGIIQNRTGLEVMRQQQLLNNLLRVSQKQ